MTRKEQLLKLCATDDFDVTILAYRLIAENEKLREALEFYDKQCNGGFKERFPQHFSMHNTARQALASSPLDELLEGEK